MSKAGTDIVLLGPISNALAMIPTITTVAIEKTFARITRTDETYVVWLLACCLLISGVWLPPLTACAPLACACDTTRYFPQSFQLDMANIRIEDGGSVVFPKHLFVDGTQLEVAGEMMGVDRLTIGEDAHVTFQATGRTTNDTKGHYHFHQLYAIKNAQLTANSIDMLHADHIIQFDGACTCAVLGVSAVGASALTLAWLTHRFFTVDAHWRVRRACVRPLRVLPVLGPRGVLRPAHGEGP